MPEAYIWYPCWWRINGEYAGLRLRRSGFSGGKDVSDYYTQGNTQESVLFASRNADSSFFLSVFQTHWQGLVNAQGPLNEADFRQQLGLMQLSQGVQDQIAAIQPGQSFVFSDIGVPDFLAETDWGMPLHDGDKPDEDNQIVFTRFAPVTDKLIVHVLLNNRDRGFAHWHELKTCLSSYTPSPGGSAGYNAAQLDQIHAELKSTGTSTLKPMNGSEGRIVACVTKSKYQP
jgi:hypothetical protein